MHRTAHGRYVGSLPSGLQVRSSARPDHGGGGCSQTGGLPCWGGAPCGGAQAPPVAGAGPDQPVADVRAMEGVVDQAIAGARFNTVVLGIFAAMGFGQCPSTEVATYPNPPLTYPMTSDRYAVQYKVNGGNWTNAQVYISIYGGTNSSPYQPFTNTQITNYQLQVPITRNYILQVTENRR